MAFNTEPPNFYKVHLQVYEDGKYTKEYDDKHISLCLNEEQAIHMWANNHGIDTSEINKDQQGDWYMGKNKIVIKQLPPSKGKIDPTKIWYG